MNIENIEFELKYINQTGSTLDLDERIKLELLLQGLSETHPADKILFWGKVEGTSKDYYIAVNIDFQGKFDFPEKKFYWT